MAEVYLAVLGIAKLYSVVDNAGMVCAHRADVYRFYSANTAVVFYLHPREIAQCIGHAVAVEALKFLAA